MPLTKWVYRQLRKRIVGDEILLRQSYLLRSEFRYVLWLDHIYEKISEVPGHVMEIGVAYGRNSILFGRLIQMNGDDEIRQYYEFDTFAGYTTETLASESWLNENAWKNNSLASVQSRIQQAGVSPQCNLIAGDAIASLNDFLTSHPSLRAALLYIDCNSYQVALDCMNMMMPYMTPGGVICIDEKKRGGETKTLIEFCKSNNLKFRKDTFPFSIPAYTVVQPLQSR